jgi:hypothetical protein
MMYPKPEPRKKKPSKIKPMTQQRKSIQTKMEKVYREIAEERPNCCESCGKNEYENSHIIPKSRDRKMISVKENIVLQCRECHKLWEDGYIWLLENGYKVMMWLKETNEEYYYTKLYQFQDRAIEQDCFNELPQWAKNLE